MIHPQTNETPRPQRLTRTFLLGLQAEARQEYEAVQERRGQSFYEEAQLPGGKRRWSGEELALLRQHYPRVGAYGMQKDYGIKRSRGSITHKAWRLKLERPAGEQTAGSCIPPLPAEAKFLRSLAEYYEYAHGGPPSTRSYARWLPWRPKRGVLEQVIELGLTYQKYVLD